MPNDLDDIVYDSKKALPNKLLQADGSITDMTGKVVESSSLAYINEKALPNKFLNPDGSYSTLNEIIASMVDTDVFVIVDELPATGNPKKIYLVPDGEGGFTEYHYINGKWDPVGMIEIDLSDYPTKKEMANAITTALQSAKDYTDSAIRTSITDVLDDSY